MVNRLLVANRAEIASRIFRTCRRLGIETVAIHSDADAELPYVAEADFAVRLPGNAPVDTYLAADLVIRSALSANADAVHPGYGFLSENADFARAVEAAGLIWVGPTPESIEAMGSKIEAKALMRAAGVPVLEAPEEPTEADMPLLVKASAGGGGRGMRIVRALGDLETEVKAAQAEAESAFGDGTVFVEPYVERGRHVEVQVVGDGAGGVAVFGERDCSVQRRHQKVIEEAPAPDLPEETRVALHEAARKAAAAVSYRGAGTLEFLYDRGSDRFWFLEMNTRLQVEHPVTEEVHGVDLVERQIAVAEGGGFDTPASASDHVETNTVGHAVEVRLYAEDPSADYQPQSGKLRTFTIPVPDGVRVEPGYVSGSTVSTFYDAMLAKVIAHAPTREQAIRTLVGVLRGARIHGLKTNREQLIAILTADDFRAGRLSTGMLDGNLGVLESSSDTRTPMIQRGAPVAAAIALAVRSRRPGFPIAWRNVPSQRQRTEFEDVPVVEWAVERGEFVVCFDDAADWKVANASAEQVTLEWDRVRTTHEISISGPRGAEVVDVDSPHGHVELRRVPRFTDPADQVAEGSLLAPMPGSVVAVHAAEGEIVAVGEPLLVIEAMKMQHTVTAPTDGVLTQINVTPGTQVAAGEVLAVVEEAE